MLNHDRAGVSGSGVALIAFDAAMLGAAAEVASYLPARRALRTNPMAALRSD